MFEGKKKRDKQEFLLAKEALLKENSWIIEGCSFSTINSLSQHLVSEYGNGFNSKNLHRMVQFSEIFPDEQIAVSLTRQLSWTHFVILIPIQDSLKRDFLC